VAEDVDGGVRGENAYLRHLTYEGANRRYPEITEVTGNVWILNY
jgi:DNA polymerase-3 subunit alpha